MAASNTWGLLVFRVRILTDSIVLCEGRARTPAPYAETEELVVKCFYDMSAVPCTSAVIQYFTRTRAVLWNSSVLIRRLHRRLILSSVRDAHEEQFTE